MQTIKHLGLAATLLGPFLTTSVAMAVATADVQGLIGKADVAVAKQAKSIGDLSRQLLLQAEQLDLLAKQLAAQQAAEARLRPLVDQAIKQANDDVESARREFGEREVGVREATAAVTAARTELSRQMAGVQRSAGEERKAFASSAQFKSLTDAVAKQQAEVDRIATELEARAGEDVAYAKLAAEAAQLEQRVEALRSASPVDADALAEASASWIAARNAAELQRQAIFARHPPYATATEQLAKTKADLELAQAAFERSILTTPGVAEAQLAMQSAKDAIKAAEERLAVAKREQARSAQVITQRRTAQQTLVKLQRDAAAEDVDVRGAIARTQAGLAATAKQLAANSTDLTAVRETFRDALKRLQQIDAANAAAGTNATKAR